MLQAALNKSWRDHVTNKEVYGNIPRITDTIGELLLRFSIMTIVTSGETEAK